MDHYPFRQTFELGIYTSTAGKNIVECGKYSPVKFENFVYFRIRRGKV